jgi:hypothetical protein
VNLENLADIGMADLGGVANLGREPFAEAGLSALEGNAPLQLLIDGFVHNAHASLGDLAHDAKAVIQKLARLEGMFVGSGWIKRIQ